MPERDVSTTEWLRLKRLSEAYPETVEAPAYVPMAELIPYSSWMQAEKFNALAEEQLQLQKEYYEKELGIQKTIFALYAEYTAETFAEYRRKWLALGEWAQNAVTAGQKIVLEQAEEGIIKGFEKQSSDLPNLSEILGGFALGGTMGILIVVMILVVVGMGFMVTMKR